MPDIDLTEARKAAWDGYMAYVQLVDEGEALPATEYAVDAALTAALPHIEAKVREEVAAAIEALGAYARPQAAAAYSNAARIARTPAPTDDGDRWCCETCQGLARAATPTPTPATSEDQCHCGKLLDCVGACPTHGRNHE